MDAFEYAKNSKSLAETLGFIRSYFTFSPRLKELTDRVFNLKVPPIKRKAFELKLEELETWKEKSKRDVQIFSENEFLNPIDELAKYLDAEIDKEAHKSFLAKIMCWCMP